MNPADENAVSLDCLTQSEIDWHTLYLIGDQRPNSPGVIEPTNVEVLMRAAEHAGERFSSALKNYRWDGDNEDLEQAEVCLYRALELFARIRTLPKLA